MKKYSVVFSLLGQRSFECEAENKEEAEQKFDEWQAEWDINEAIQVFLDDECDFDVMFVEEN